MPVLVLAGEKPRCSRGRNGCSPSFAYTQTVVRPYANNCAPMPVLNRKKYEWCSLCSPVFFPIQDCSLQKSACALQVGRVSRESVGDWYLSHVLRRGLDGYLTIYSSNRELSRLISWIELTQSMNSLEWSFWGYYSFLQKKYPSHGKCSWDNM